MTDGEDYVTLDIPVDSIASSCERIHVEGQAARKVPLDFQDGLACASGLADGAKSAIQVRAQQCLWRILGRARTVLELRSFALTLAQESELGERPLQLHFSHAIVPDVLLRYREPDWHIVAVTDDAVIHHVTLSTSQVDVPRHQIVKHAIRRKGTITKVVFSDAHVILAFADGKVLGFALPFEPEAWDELEFRTTDTLLRSVRSIFFRQAPAGPEPRPSSDSFVDLVFCDRKIWGLTATGVIKIWHTENGACLKTQSLFDVGSDNSALRPSTYLQVVSGTSGFSQVVACYNGDAASLVLFGIHSDDFGAVRDIDQISSIAIPTHETMQAFRLELADGTLRLWLRTDGIITSTYFASLPIGTGNVLTPRPFQWRPVPQERPLTTISAQVFENCIERWGDIGQAGQAMLQFPGRYSTAVLRAAASGLGTDKVPLQRDIVTRLILERISETDESGDERASWLNLFSVCNDLSQMEFQAHGSAQSAFDSAPVFLTAAGVEILLAADLPFELDRALVTPAAHRLVSDVMPAIYDEFDSRAHALLDLLFLDDRRQAVTSYADNRWHSLACQIIEDLPEGDLIEPDSHQLDGLNSEDINELISSLSPAPYAPDAPGTPNLLSQIGRLLLAKRLHLYSVTYSKYAKQLLLVMILTYHKQQGAAAMTADLTLIARVWHGWYVLKALLESSRSATIRNPSEDTSHGFLFSWLQQPQLKLDVVAETLSDMRRSENPINQLSKALLSDLDFFQPLLEGQHSTIDRPALFAKSIALHGYSKEALIMLDLLEPSHMRNFAEAMSLLVEGDFDQAAERFRACAGHISRLEWDSDNALQPLSGEVTSPMMDMAQYWGAVSEAFEDLGDPVDALRFAQAAKDASMDRSPDDAHYSRVFDLAMSLHYFEEAQEALMEMTSGPSQTSKLHDLIETCIVEDCETVIFDCDYANLHIELDQILFRKALESSTGSEPNFVSLCYAYRINIGHMRSAAELMTRMARRTVSQARGSMQVIDFRLVESAVDMYSLAINALGLVNPSDQWVVLMDCDDTAINLFKRSTLRREVGAVVLSLDDIKGERAYIQLMQLAQTHVPGEYQEDLANLLQLASLGSNFDRALDLAVQAGADLGPIFATIANTCSDFEYEQAECHRLEHLKKARITIEDGEPDAKALAGRGHSVHDSWSALHERLKALDDPRRSYPGYRATLAAILKSSRLRDDKQCPNLVPWLVNHFLQTDPGYLITSLLREGWIEEASKICLRAVRSTRYDLSNFRDKGIKRPSSSPSLSPDYGVYDRVLWAIDQVTAQLSSPDEVSEKAMFGSLRRDIIGEVDLLMKLIKIKDLV